MHILFYYRIDSKEFKKLLLSFFENGLLLPFKKGSNERKSDIKSLVARVFPKLFC